VCEAASISDEDPADEARRKLDDVLHGTESGIADRVASVMGLSSASFPHRGELLGRKTPTGAPRPERALVVNFEDIHWAEPTFLDWIDHVVDLAAASIPVVCAARPELREERPSWEQVSPRASVLDLQPLTGSDSDALIDNLLGASGATSEVRGRITTGAQGNPLFVEQIISMWIDDGTLYRDNGSWRLRTEASPSIPPTISALLSARLDRLAQEERTVVAGASVIGQVFYRGAVEELCPLSSSPRFRRAFPSWSKSRYWRACHTPSGSCWSRCRNSWSDCSINESATAPTGRRAVVSIHLDHPLSGDMICGKLEFEVESHHVWLPNHVQKGI
jgi:hypothetical protein